MFYQDGLDENTTHSLNVTNFGSGGALSLSSIDVKQFRTDEPTTSTSTSASAASSSGSATAYVYSTTLIVSEESTHALLCLEPLAILVTIPVSEPSLGPLSPSSPSHSSRPHFSFSVEGSDEGKKVQAAGSIITSRVTSSHSSIRTVLSHQALLVLYYLHMLHTQAMAAAHPQVIQRHTQEVKPVIAHKLKCTQHR